MTQKLAWSDHLGAMNLHLNLVSPPLKLIIRYYWMLEQSSCYHVDDANRCQIENHPQHPLPKSKLVTLSCLFYTHD